MMGQVWGQVDERSLMSDAATPNLPSRDFEKTSRFYSALGFAESWRDRGWMILKRGDMTLEFFPHPELDPLSSWFSWCLRFDDLDTFLRDLQRGRYSRRVQRTAEAHPPKIEPSGCRIGALVDPDGILVRLILSDDDTAGTACS